MLNSANKIPITLICGYLGAGKTSLINQLLASATKPLGILVNDFGALNIDADLINNSAGQTLELTNGCLCCQITDDLGDSLQQLAETNISEVIIEASGVAQPASIREYVQSWPGYRLAGTFTVIDASQMSRGSNTLITQADRTLAAIIPASQLVRAGLSAIFGQYKKM